LPESIRDNSLQSRVSVRAAQGGWRVFDSQLQYGCGSNSGLNFLAESRQVEFLAEVEALNWHCSEGCDDA
jgi:hypothetical protein